ncbi:hypothetical protein D3272_23020 [Lichenibacterium ramalinae]|uniref:Uncharacterized protein n=1 Tax=Lichenibacterium ramalinae TaxID=2316527 RepID=A0A4Q2R7T8_9HYPH|nr:hypothetical protein D3272_23020 [Lichenibacterium ramalinae]
MHQLQRTLPVAIIASDDLYRVVRGALVTQGTTLNAWCNAKGVNRQTVEKALKGLRHSRKSRALVDQLIAETLQVGGEA